MTQQQQTSNTPLDDLACGDSRTAIADGGLLLPMGGGYDALMAGLSAALFGRAASGEVRVILLPASFSSDPLHISAAERADNLQAAELRRATMEKALQALAPPGAGCSVMLAPIFTRADAEDHRHLALFGPTLNAAFLLGGDQAVAMRVLADTPIERALCDLHRRGGIIAGTSAGAAVQSQTMLAGYSDGVDAPHALEFGITSIWDQPDRRGLVFGQPGVIIDQHFFQRGRMARLLEAILRPNGPAIGIGIDAFTGLQMPPDHIIGHVFGRSAVAILDAESLAAADTRRYCGERRSVSVRNVLLHLLAPGPFSYDLNARRHSLAARPTPNERRRTPLTLPPNAGLLLLSGSPATAAADETLLQQFMAACAPCKPLLVVALDAEHAESAQQCAGRLAEIAAASTQRRIGLVRGLESLAVQMNGAEAYAGIVVFGNACELRQPTQLTMLAAAWRLGAALWLGGAAAGLAGHSVSSLPPLDQADTEQMAQARAPLPASTPLCRGLGLLPVTLPARVLEDCRWNELLALAHAVELPALGLGAATTLAVSAQRAEVLGAGTVFALDLRGAERQLGENGAFVIANGLLDAFAVGDTVTLAVF